MFQGVSTLLDNPLVHPLLKNILPEMRNLVHDTSEKVRIAFIDLLLKVKGMRAIKVRNSFVYRMYSHVSLPHI
jgi:condensin-2 complex subunit G2